MSGDCYRLRSNNGYDDVWKTEEAFDNADDAQNSVGATEKVSPEHISNKPNSKDGGVDIINEKPGDDGQWGSGKRYNVKKGPLTSKPTDLNKPHT